MTKYDILNSAYDEELLFLSKSMFRYQLCLMGISNIENNKWQRRKYFVGQCF